MTPVGRQKLLVSVNMEQKQQAEIGGKLLYLGVDWNWSGIERNPVLARVLSVSADVLDVAADDWVLCSHHAFDQVQRISNTKEILRDDTGEMDGKNKIFALSHSLIEASLVDGVVMPVKGKMIVEPIRKPSRSTLIIDPIIDNYATRFKVVSVGLECDGINKGDIIEVFKHSNYEMVYVWEKQRHLIMVVNYQDVHSLVGEAV